jgi:hypothetical protein
MVPPPGAQPACAQRSSLTISSLVEILVADLEAARLEPVGLEAELAIEVAGGSGGGHHGRVELLDVVEGMLDDLTDQQPPKAAAARRGAHVDAPQQALVAFLLRRRHGKARRADQRAVDERAERRAPAEPRRDLFEAACRLLLEGRRESAGIEGQRLEPARLERRRIGSAK